MVGHLFCPYDSTLDKNADIMGDLTDGMRDFTGVINLRIHWWR